MRYFESQVAAAAATFDNPRVGLPHSPLDTSISFNASHNSPHCCCIPLHLSSFIAREPVIVGHRPYQLIHQSQSMAMQDITLANAELLGILLTIFATGASSL